MVETTDGDGARTCPSCGEAVPSGRSACPSCSTLLPPQQAPADPAATPPPGWGPAPGPAAAPWPPAAPAPSGPPIPPPGSPAGGAYGAPMWGAPAPAPRRSNRAAWLVPLLVLVGFGLAAALVVFIVGQTADGESSSKDRSATSISTRPTIPTTTTLPRVAQRDLLSAYCNAPGAKWPEVAPHVPGEPGRTFVRYMGGGLSNAADTREALSQQIPDAALGGSTVISPRTDSVFTDDESVLGRTRTVTCVTFLATEPTGQDCQYNGNSFNTPFGSPVGAQLARNKYAITVYELRSGGILHKGEIHTRAGGCPEWAITDQGDGLIAHGLTEQDVLSWINSHFVDGKPA